MTRPGFICGVAEGFYGRPWSPAERRQLFDWMRAWGLNTYLYAPKDDLKHRILWRAPYSGRETTALKALLRDCRARGLSFIYAVAPGLDMIYSRRADARALLRKASQLVELGCRRFAILFDDIPGGLTRADAAAFGSLAAAQAFAANHLLAYLRAAAPGADLFFCPTAYCGRMSGPPRRSEYLKEIGRRLDPDIRVFWTGPDIVSRTIPVGSLRELRRVLRRRPVLWDNLHANDYDQRRLFLGPCAGRPPGLRAEIDGILSNPNRELEANYVPLRTLAGWARAERHWNPRQAFRAALREWLPRWRTHGPQRLSLADLELLGDCFYLPFEFGPRAQALLDDLRRLQSGPAVRTRAAARRLDRTCATLIGLFDRLAGLANRELLYALYRPAWELREEAALLQRYARWRRTHPGKAEKFSAPEFQPGHFRGGITAELQRLLPMDARGRFGPPPPGP